MENLLIKLSKAGLTGNESKVYLELIKKGELSANTLAKNIGMDRTLTYTVLNHLIEKGFVSYISKENKKFFKASSPENLLNPIREKQAYVADLISDLKKIEKMTDISHEINIYEGKEGLRTFLKELSKADFLYSFGATGRLYEALYEMPHVAKEFIKQGKKGKIILSGEHKLHKIIKIKNLEFRYLELKSEATTSIFGDKVSIHIIKEKPIIIIIKNKFITESYKAHFEVLWNSAKKL